MIRTFKYRDGEFHLIKEEPSAHESNGVHVVIGDGHWSDCATHNEPAFPNGECDCGGLPPARIQ